MFAVDVRGYGDSTGWPSEDGVVKDVLTLYNFIKAIIEKHKAVPRIFFYGHSLGTG